MFKFKLCILLVFSLLAGSILSSCKKKNVTEEEKKSQEYDRSSFLINSADNLILPAYGELKKSVDLLSIQVSMFNTQPTINNILLLRELWLKSYSSWQYCSIYEFGPAMEQNLRLSLNTFPVDTTQINSNISSGNYNLVTASNADARGFPSLDYLLFNSNQSDTDLVKAFALSAIRKKYISDVTLDIQNKVNTVYDSWKDSGGNYAATYKSNTGIDAGSSLGMLVNQLNFDFEILRNAKVGIPLGKKSLDTPFPEKVEGYYSGYSKELLIHHLTSLENVYLGRTSNGVNNSGLDDYLDFLNAQYSGTTLNFAISSAFSNAKTALQAIPDPLSQAISNNSSSVDNAYVKLQQLLVLLKADMPSSLGILITYQDNDGD